MPVDHTEKGFEQAIEDHLLHHGYRKGAPANFDASLAMDSKTLIEFLSTTQKNDWGRLSAIYGTETDRRSLRPSPATWSSGGCSIAFGMASPTGASS